jgi:hypothetical protein
VRELFPMLSAGCHVRLITFNGTPNCPNGTDTKEDYWKLIGWRGIIFLDAPVDGISADRVLVKFDDDVSTSGLHSHNPEANSLWIKRSDLEMI